MNRVTVFMTDDVTIEEAYLMSLDKFGPDFDLRGPVLQHLAKCGYVDFVPFVGYSITKSGRQYLEIARIC